MAWRSKEMPLAEWGPFQDAYKEVFMAMRADPEMALFIQNEPGDELSRLFITGRNAELVERLAPGGWTDSEAPSGRRISLLVGSANCAEKFGVELGKH